MEALAGETEDRKRNRAGGEERRGEEFIVLRRIRLAFVACE
jgi:hypothetical protein